VPTPQSRPVPKQGVLHDEQSPAGYVCNASLPRERSFLQPQFEYPTRRRRAFAASLALAPRAGQADRKALTGNGIAT